MRRKTCDVTTGRRLSVLKPMLKAWASTQLQYSDVWGECGWWYNERTSIGFLSVAAWQSGGIAIEEYSTSKGIGSESYSGRCDLYFATGRRSKSAEFIAEAKQSWIRVSDLCSGHERIMQNLEDATRDSMTCSDDVRRRLGITFAVPNLQPSMVVDRKLVDSWFHNLAHIDADASAWVSPRHWQEMKGDDGRVYPGVALFMRIARW